MMNLSNLLAFILGIMFCLFVSIVRDIIKKHRDDRAGQVLDCGYDTQNYINQRQRTWEPFETDDGITLYKLQ